MSWNKVDFGWAALRVALDEPVPGTAPERAASWLLVEHPRPWPSVGWLADLPLSPAGVLEAGVALSVRRQLIRPVRERRRRARNVVPAGSWPTRAALAGGVRAVGPAGARRSGFGRGRRGSGSGEWSGEPVVLGCTLGKRDVCCARRGRPVPQALEEELPGRVWETAHVGGDPFAANVVTLPHGTYHGGVRADMAGVLAMAALGRRVVLGHLRGTAGLPAAAQAAEFFVRPELGITGLAAVRTTTVPALDDGVEDVLVHVGTRSFSVRLSRRQVADVRLTSCAGGRTHDRPYVRELMSLVELSQPVVA